MLQFFGYKNCDTSRKAEKYLQSKKIDYAFVDVTQKPPSMKLLKMLLSNTDMPLKKFFNTSGQEYRKLKIKDQMATMTLADAVKLLGKNGRLIKRPLVIDGKKVSVGFKDDFKEKWG